MLMTYDQRSVSMGGLITEIRMKATKNGSMMAFVQLEDLYGVTEVLVFPKVYEAVGGDLHPESAVLMAGKLSVREEEAPKLLLDRVVPLKELEAIRPEEYSRENGGTNRRYSPSEYADGASRQRVLRETPAGDEKSGKLYLKLTADTREEVLRILCRTPGDICVMLHMADEKKTYQAPREYWVSAGYDREALVGLLGDGCVVLK
jgi:DNA polymerase-3 subunit alpha